MAWKLLPTDFTDAVWSGLKRYTQIDNEDGTVSFRDVTTYTGKEKSFFGAMDANRMNDTLNVIMSMLENGTDLYELFQAYFAEQKTLFTGKADTEFAGYENYVLAHKEEIDTNVEAIRKSTDTEYANYEQYLQEYKDEIAAVLAALRVSTDTSFENFTEYVKGLEEQGDSAIDGIKTDYRKEMDDFQSGQERLFNVWFEVIRSRLSGDVATSLQDQIDGLDDKVDGFVGKQTVFSSDGKNITETCGDTQLLVTFNDDGSIIEQQVKGGVVTQTKKTTFSADGLEIKEEIL
ncbi:MAG: hypothetical protein NC548_57315 [Lachnospiraceae bacterium]|nr:hypothetical protein [Lachnospiraceae bacterium]